MKSSIPASSLASSIDSLVGEVPVVYFYFIPSERPVFVDQSFRLKNLLTEEGSVLEIPLPGVDPSHLELRLRNGQLFLSAFRLEGGKCAAEHGGRFHGVILLPPGIGKKEIKAEFDEEILQVRLCKKVVLDGRARRLTLL